MNKHFEELIEKYLKGTLIEEEKELLEKMLRAPENQLYLAAEIDKKFVEPSFGEEVDDEIGSQLFKRIQQRIDDDRAPGFNLTGDEQNEGVIRMASSRNKILRWMAVAAASIIIVISVVYLNDNKSNEQKIASQKSTQSKDSIHTYLRTEINNTGKDKSLQLSDGSAIILASKSEITYYEPFTSRRDITLKGKALFQVAKNKTKPFTVISGDISTTALGTEFTVTAFENARRIIVRLYEGKVVVKGMKTGNKKLKKQIFLLPGEEFIYDKSVARVKTFKVDKTATAEELMKEEFSGDEPSIPENTEGSWYMFNNQSLSLVFDELAQMYNVKIIYDKKDIRNMYFIGKFDKSRSIDVILERIAIVNDLMVTKKDSVFIISK